MLLNPSDFSLAQSGEKVLRRLSGTLHAHAAPETHASVIELATGIHSDVAGAVAEFAALRAHLDRQLRAMGLIAASAGMYPLANSGETRVSGSARYRVVAGSMRTLARREPTLALHVHIGIPDPEEAIRVLNRLRGAVPVLLALSANSPFCQGRDSGFASARISCLGAGRRPCRGLDRGAGSELRSGWRRRGSTAAVQGETLVEGSSDSLKDGENDLKGRAGALRIEDYGLTFTQYYGSKELDARAV